MEFAPWRLSGTVIGVLMNHAPALAALGDAVNAAPYKAPPKAPVLYLKPRNTHCGPGARVALPMDVPEVEIGAALGLVIGRTACKVAEAEALEHVAGLTIVADLCVPHESVYRPSVRQRARDGFCPIGPRVWPLRPGLDVGAMTVRVAVDGAEVHRTTTGDRIRPAARLIADVSAFMTLSVGDVLMLGVCANAPRAGAGHAVAVAIDGLGELTFELVREGGAA